MAPGPPAPSVEFKAADGARVAELLARATGSDLSSVAHALEAHALAGLESFDELLAPGALQGVDSHRYQVDTVRRVLRTLRGRALLADEVGLGKTVEALMVLREYQLRGMVRRALVLTPAALVGQWADELATKTGLVAVTTADAGVRDDFERFWGQPGVLVASIPLARSPRHARFVQAQPWDMVIVDEAHHVKNRSTVSYKLVDGLKTRFLLLLTATPIENDLEELYNLITLLKPGQFATPAAFHKQFVDSANPTSPRNREMLRRLLGEVMVRNTRATCGLGLPPRFVTTVVVEPLAEERALYEETLAFFRAHAHEPSARLIATTVLLEAGSSARAVATTLARIRSDPRHPLGSALAPLAERAAAVRESRKAQRLVELARSHAGHVLVFSRFRESLAQAADALLEAGLPCVTFHGGMTAAEKAAAIERFRETRCAMLASDVGGEGQNLHFCHVLVNFDLPWNPMLIEQRIGRLHRMGQANEVTVYNLCSGGTLEERLLDVLDRRIHLFELVVGEMDMVLGNLSDERNIEERVLDIVAGATSEQDLTRGFDTIAGELLVARTRYDRTRSLDAALFGEDFEA